MTKKRWTTRAKVNLILLLFALFCFIAMIVGTFPMYFM